MAMAAHVALGKRQSLAGGDAQHRLDDIDAGHHFGDGVLDLEARIDLQKVVGIAAHDEFDRADPAIIQTFAEPHRVGRPSCREAPREDWRQGLPRSPSGDAAAANIRARTDEPRCLGRRRRSALRYGVHARSAFRRSARDSRTNFSPRAWPTSISTARPSSCETARMPLPPPPAAAFSITGSPSSRTVAAISVASSLGHFAAGHGRHAGRLCLALGGRLVAQPLDHVGRRADEDQARGLDRARERSIFGQKAKPRMNRLARRRSSPPRSRRRSADSCRRRRLRRSRWTRRSALHAKPRRRPRSGHRPRLFPVDGRFAQCGRRFHRDWQSGFS